MARPLKEGMDYFPHDVDASQDEKILAIEALYKNDGYAWYFKLLERMYRSREGSLELSTDLQYRVLAATLKTDVNTCKSFIDDAIGLGLFTIQNQGLTSNGVMRRRAFLLRNRERVREWRASQANQQEESNVTNEAQSITNTNNKGKYGEFENVLLSDIERDKLVEKFGQASFNDKVEAMSQGIASKGYKYRDHYAAILAWDRKDKKDSTGTKPTGDRYLRQRYGDIVKH